jgi:hypothetical protein
LQRDHRVGPRVFASEVLAQGGLAEKRHQGKTLLVDLGGFVRRPIGDDGCTRGCDGVTGLHIAASGGIERGDGSEDIGVGEGETDEVFWLDGVGAVESTQVSVALFGGEFLV